MELDDELAEVLVKIGDKILIEFTKLDHIHGRIEGRPLKIFSRDENGYKEGKEIELEDNLEN